MANRLPKGFGVSVGGAEWNLARSPLWHPVKHGPAALRVGGKPTALWRAPFLQVAGQTPDYRDQMHLIGWTTAFVAEGSPTDRLVSMSAIEACRWMGFQGRGGSQLETLRRSLATLKSIVIESAIREPGNVVRRILGWGLLDAYVLGRHEVTVQLSEVLAAQARLGCLTYVDRATMHAIAAADLVAARLWLFLEAESLERTIAYRINGERPESPDQHSFAPLAVLLGLGDPKPSRRIRRIREAAAEIEHHDHRYELEVVARTDGRDCKFLARRTRRRGGSRRETRVGAVVAIDGLDARRLAPGPAANDVPSAVPGRAFRRIPFVTSTVDERPRQRTGLTSVGEIARQLNIGGSAPDGEASR